MLLRIRHIGTDHTERDGQRRLYHVQTHTGLSGIIALCAAQVKYGKPPRVEIRLVGTAYLREYPAAGNLDDGTAPRIADLEGGYSTVASFIATWEHATPEQRVGLWQYDKSILRHIRKRDRWTFRATEDRPRELPAVPSNNGGTWYRVQAKDLRAALKGTSQAVRIGSATIKPAILRQLLTATRAKQIELRDAGGALGIQTVDKRTRCTVLHGAGDPYAGRNGFEARLVLRAA